MNTTNPLFDEGLKPVAGKSAFFFKVMAVLFVHLVFIAVLLMQGCTTTKSGDTAAQPGTDTTTQQ